MQTSIKAFCLGTFALSGLFFALPALAQTYTPSYYPQQYSSQYATPSYGQSCPTLSYNLTLGASDYTTAGQVSSLQSFLRSRYGDARLSGGYYGQLTTYYVSRFQQEQGLYPVTGGVGPLTRQAIQRVCGGGYYPTPTPAPQPSTTFRLNRDFDLSEGQSAHLSGGQLDITLNQIVNSVSGYGYYYNSDPTSVRITLGLSCNSGTYCFYYPTQTYTLAEGDSVSFQGYTATLVSLYNNGATFRVRSSGNTTNNATISLTRPTAGTSVTQGEALTVSWNSSNTPTNSQVLLDLYTAAGTQVGTIASVSSSQNAYVWSVPRVPNNLLCTQQYPNGLCGQNLSGSYYIKATLLPSSTYTAGSALDSDTSGTFTIVPVNGTGQNVSAYPQSGYAPLVVNFAPSTSGYYAVDFGDGTAASMLQGSVSHTYYGRGTYVAQFTSDMACMHANPRCMIATQTFGSATVTVY